jgi:hypothetical protein
MKNRAIVARNRIYADFLMPSRLPALRRMLETILAAGYEVVSIATWWSRQADGRTGEPGRTGAPGRTVILRHDIDTDPGTGRRMWEIERSLGIAGSFFFRLSTLDVRLMQDIADAGGHASYHYEELATVAKRRRLRTPAAVEPDLAEIRDEFRGNLARLRSTTGLPLDIVASHGDFANRRLGMPNWLILADDAFREETGIVLEAYDEALMGSVTSRHTDTLHPRYWVGEDPLAAVAQGNPVVHVLLHPRHWRTAPVTNALDDLGRFRESLAYDPPWGRRDSRR